ncbi:hypothetical protein BASA81_003714 [Batrachochytrium salamandrivorans]|nr:hypothetical protein BASA81_003714 [Batrachochytrium salamandrivorans]
MSDSPLRSSGAMLLESFAASSGQSLLQDEEVQFLHEAATQLHEEVPPPPPPYPQNSILTPLPPAPVPLSASSESTNKKIRLDEDPEGAEEEEGQERGGEGEDADSQDIEEDEEEEEPVTAMAPPKRVPMGHKAFFLHPAENELSGVEKLAFKLATQAANGQLRTSPVPMFALPSVEDMREYQTLCLEGFMARYQTFVDQISKAHPPPPPPPPSSNQS